LLDGDRIGAPGVLEIGGACKISLGGAAVLAVWS
jgi:hypothetical protein